MLNEQLQFADSRQLIEAPLILSDARRRDSVKMERIFDEMPVKLRGVLRACDLAGYSINETAIALKTPAATIRSRLYRARAIFRKKWQLELGRPTL